MNGQYADGLEQPLLFCLTDRKAEEIARTRVMPKVLNCAPLRCLLGDAVVDVVLASTCPLDAHLHGQSLDNGSPTTRKTRKTSAAFVGGGY